MLLSIEGKVLARFWMRAGEGSRGHGFMETDFSRRLAKAVDREVKGKQYGRTL